MPRNSSPRTARSSKHRNRLRREHDIGTMAGRPARERASVNYSEKQLEQPKGTPAWLNGKSRSATTGGDDKRSQRLRVESKTGKANPPARPSRKDVAVKDVGNESKSTSQSRDALKKSPQPAKHPVRTRTSNEGLSAAKPASKPNRASKASQSTVSEPEKRLNTRNAPPVLPPSPADAPAPLKSSRRSAPSPTAAPAATGGGNSRKMIGNKRQAEPVAEAGGQGASKRRRSAPESSAATQSSETPPPLTSSVMQQKST